MPLLPCTVLTQTSVLNKQFSCDKKVKKNFYRPEQALSLPAGSGCQISRPSAHESSKFISPTHRPSLPNEIFLVLNSISSWVNTRAVVRREGLRQYKICIDTTGKRTRNLPASSALPQPTAPSGVPFSCLSFLNPKQSSFRASCKSARQSVGRSFGL